MTGRPIRVLELRSVRGTGGGPEKTILQGAALAASEFNITVCYLRDERDSVFGLDSRARALNLDYVEVHERHSFDPSIWRKLKDLVRDKSIDIVHSHDYKTDLLAYALGRTGRVIPLATAHGWVGHSWREKIYYAGDKRLLVRFPFVITVSTDIRNVLLKHGGHDDRLMTILNTIDPNAFRRNVHEHSDIRKELGIGADELVIGAVGRLEKQKRFDILMESFAGLRRRHSAPLRLVIAGDGSLSQDLEQRHRDLGLADSCLLLGDRKDVTRLHHAFDLFVQSSSYEGTPNVVLEAMALETPIVATDAGGTAEVARPGLEALIVPVENADALTNAMEEALFGDRAATRERVRLARLRVETELSFVKRTRKLEAVYARLMASAVSTAN